MAGWHHENAKWKPKKCAVCEAEFIPHSGVHKFCSVGCKGMWKYITGIVTTASQYELISGNWSRYTSRLLAAGGKKRSQLTREILLQKLEDQQYRCALTGVPLTCNLKKGVISPTNASVDRIIAGGPYTADNIQMVCRAVNMWRGDLPIEEYVGWCQKVVNHYRTLHDEQGEKEHDHG